ncbi:MAG: hypothetical protein Q9221_009043 [Calogaya cf. arnoldii]
MASPGPQRQPYSQTLQNDTLYQNVLYAINQVHIFGSATCDTHAFHTASGEVQKHVTLLDHITLLLVYKAKGDVVATGLLREGKSFTVVWAKNSNYTPSDPEQNYLSSLLKAFIRLDHPAKILKKVAGMCKPKILARVRKLTNAAPPPADHSRNYFDLVEWDQGTEAMRKFLLQKQLIRDQPLADTLDGFINVARGLGPDSDVNSLVKVLMFAYWLSLSDRGPKLDELRGVNTTMSRRVKKLGAWFQACLVIHRTVELLGPAVRADLSQRQINPPSPKPHRPYGDTMKALNTWTQRYNLTPFKDFGTVKNRYPTASPGAPGSSPEIVIAAAQHCELTIGLEVWRTTILRNQRQTVEVGCSKASCFYCRLVIEEFNRWVHNQPKPNKIVLRGQHDKYILGWAMPINTPLEVRNRVLEGIGEEMQAIHTEAGGSRRLSDSQSPPSHTKEVNEAARLEQNAMLGSGGPFF